MTPTELEAILARVSFRVPGLDERRFRVLDKGDGWLIQVVYMEPDINTGVPEEQHGRKWYVSSHATETEVVETAFAAVCRSMLHVAGEWFLYQGRRVYSPHFHIGARIDLCDGEAFDARPAVKP